MPEAPSCDPVPGLETVFARGDEDAPENHRCAVEVEAVPVGRVDLIAPDDHAVVQAEGEERAGTRVPSGHGAVRRAGGDVREVRTESDACRSDDAAAVGPGGDRRCAPDEGAVAQRIGTQPAPRRRQLGTRARADEDEAAHYDRRPPEVIVARVRPQRRALPDRTAGALVEADDPIGGRDDAAVRNCDPPEVAEPARARAASVDSGWKAPPPPRAPRPEIEGGNHAANRGGEDLAVHDRRRSSNSSFQVGAPVDPRAQDPAAVACGGQIVCGQFPGGVRSSEKRESAAYFCLDRSYYDSAGQRDEHPPVETLLRRRLPRHRLLHVSEP